MATVQVRYIVRDVDAAVAFYCRHLGFKEAMHPAPAFAMLTRGDLRLVLSAPNPAPGGRPARARWDRAGAGRVESNLDRSAGSRCHRPGSAEGRSPLSQRSGYRSGRQADHRGRSLGQPRRAVRAALAGGPFRPDPVSTGLHASERRKTRGRQRAGSCRAARSAPPVTRAVLHRQLAQDRDPGPDHQIGINEKKAGTPGPGFNRQSFHDYDRQDACPREIFRGCFPVMDRRKWMASPVVHFEIIGKDAPAPHKFCCQVFGWKLSPPAVDTGRCTMVDSERQRISGAPFQAESLVACCAVHHPRGARHLTHPLRRARVQTGLRLRRPPPGDTDFRQNDRPPSPPVVEGETTGYKAASRNQVRSFPRPFTCSTPRGTQRNSPRSSSYVDSAIWILPATPCDSMRLATLTVSPHTS
jgi:catechol 2,3-dioxygenase-like lactoylglutathione lyase family enzyme